MKRATITALEVYTISLLIFSFLYYMRPRLISWHHLFAYLTVVGLAGLSITGAIMMRSDRGGTYRKLHIVFGILACLFLMATIITFRYGAI